MNISAGIVFNTRAVCLERVRFDKADRHDRCSPIIPIIPIIPIAPIPPTLFQAKWPCCVFDRAAEG